MKCFNIKSLFIILLAMSVLCLVSCNTDIPVDDLNDPEFNTNYASKNKIAVTVINDITSDVSGNTQTPETDINTTAVPLKTESTESTESTVTTGGPVSTTKPASTAKKSATNAKTTKLGTTVPVSTTGGTNVKIPNDPVLAAVNLYQKVPEWLKQDYVTLCNGISQQRGEIVFNKDLSSSLLLLIYYVKDYNPQFFYVDWSEINYTTASKNGIIIKTTIVFNYRNINRIASDIKKVEDKVNKIVAEANKKPNLFERELYVHDYLVNNIEYNKDTDHCADIYGALIEGKSKCEGYSRAFQYIMNKLGIETVLITGEAPGPHIWNMVKLYGKYYFVDVTFDDPVGATSVKHNYFNITTAQIKKDHTIHGKNSTGSDNLVRNTDLQQCTSTDYSYKTIMG